MASISLLSSSISITDLTFIIHHPNPNPPGTAANHRVGGGVSGKKKGLLLPAQAVCSTRPRTLGNSLVMLFISTQQLEHWPCRQLQVQNGMSHWGLISQPCMAQIQVRLKQGSTLEVSLPPSSARDLFPAHLPQHPAHSTCFFALRNCLQGLPWWSSG